MIDKMLKSDPSARPNVMALRDDPWLKEGLLCIAMLSPRQSVSPSAVWL